MRILIITRLYAPHFGGVEKHISETSKILAKKHQITILTERYDQALLEKEKIDGVQVIRFSHSNKKLIGLFSIWYWIFRNRRFVENADIVHIHDVFIWYLPFKFLFPKKPVVTTFHGWEQTFPIPLKNKIIRKVSALLSDKTVSVGKYLDDFYGTKSDLFLYGAVDKKRFNKIKKTVPLIFLGRLESDTGTKTVLKMLAKNKLKIRFIGDGSYRDKCSKFGITGQVDDVDKVLRKTKICIASGYLSAIEALSNRCKVIVVADTKIRKAIWNSTPFSQFITITRDEKELLLAIRRNSNKKIINEAEKWAKTQTWDHIVGEYEVLYNVLI